MTDFRFTKSSYSEPNGECVEVARNVPATVALRDSKLPSGDVLVVTAAAWEAFQGSLGREA